MGITGILFWALTGLALISALLVITSKNPVYSVLWLIVTFFTISGHYILLNAQFLAVVNIIVYAGAIMVLFLFVIMLLNLGAPEALKESGGMQLPAAILLALIFITALTSAGAISAGLQPSATTSEFLNNGGSVQSVGIHLFSGTEPWLFPFEVTSILLLVGIVGAIVLAKRRI